VVFIFFCSVLWHLAQNALLRECGKFPFANWNEICWGLLLQLVQLIKIHFLPHLESFIWKQKFEKNFFKKSPTQPPNWVLPICKLPFPNGSYHSGVCRALWALYPYYHHQFLEKVLVRFLNDDRIIFWKLLITTNVGPKSKIYT